MIYFAIVVPLVLQLLRRQYEFQQQQRLRQAQQQQQQQQQQLAQQQRLAQQRAQEDALIRAMQQEALMRAQQQARGRELSMVHVTRRSRSDRHTCATLSIGHRR